MIRNKKRGFSVVYFIIYLLCTTILITVAIHWHISVQHIYKKQVNALHLLIDTYLAHDLLIRDLRAAPSDTTAWMQNTETQLIWKVPFEDKAIGWNYQNNELIRTEGTYYPRTEIWHDATTTVILSDIELFSCAYEQKDGKRIVSFSFKTRLGSLMQASVRTKQGVISCVY